MNQPSTSYSGLTNQETKFQTLISRSFGVSPENILPYPKAGPRKDTNRGRKKGKTMIATDTPYKIEIEEKYREREEKKQKKEDKVRKSLFGGKKTVDRKNNHLQKPESDTDSNEDLSNFEMDKSESYLEVDEIFDRPTDLPKVSDWVVVKYCSKRSSKYFVGLVVERSSFEMTVKFARRIDGSRFKWPDVEDISIVDPDQIVLCLKTPTFMYQNDRVTSFIFKNNFKFVVE